ncbi:MAG: hypothetical protein ABIQ39_03585 [Ilumatobacteraceae bacterium]
MTAQAWFEDGDTRVAPGSSTVLRMTIINLGDTTDTFTMVPGGLAAPWTTIRPASVTLFGGSQQEIAVEVHPPLLPSTSAGNTALTVRIVPLTAPDDITTAETALVVTVLHDRRLSLLQPALRSRRKAVYEMMLDNRGNTQASCRMRLIDHQGRLEADFDPPAVGVGPGASALVRAKVHATKLQWDRRPRTITFRVEADQQGAPSAAVTGTFVQAPMVPEKLLSRVVGMLAVLAVLLVGWFALAKPAIRTAADNAVEHRLASGAATNTTTSTLDTIEGGGRSTTTIDGSASTSTTEIDSSVPSSTTAVEADQAFSTRLAVAVAPGQTLSATLDAPPAMILRVTDLILQNPNADTGTVTVKRADEVLFSWRLDNIPAQLSTPLVTPIELQPGQRLSFDVACTSVGAGSSGTCVPALLVSGRRVPATG